MSKPLVKFCVPKGTNAGPKHEIYVRLLVEELGMSRGSAEHAIRQQSTIIATTHQFALFVVRRNEFAGNMLGINNIHGLHSHLFERTPPVPRNEIDVSGN